MAITLNAIKCPECGANLSVEEGHDKIFCNYCGAQILLSNENEHIYRTIDEAGIKQAETDRIVKLKHLEMAEKDRESEEKTRSLKIKISLILGTIGIIMMVVGYMAGAASGDSNSGFYMLAVVGMFPLIAAAYVWIFPKNKDKGNAYDGKVTVPSGINNYENKSYVAIETMFKSAGFTNIQCIPLGDLRAGIFKKPDMVESIVINGSSVTSGGQRFLPDASVVISYHSFQS